MVEPPVSTPLLILIMSWMLKGFGLLWVIGGVFTLFQTRTSKLLDGMLNQVTGENPDGLVPLFGFVTGGLTVLCGIGLFLLQPWVVGPLCLLVLAQIVYFWLKRRRYLRTLNESEVTQGEIASSTYNAFKLSLLLTLATVTYFLVI